MDIVVCLLLLACCAGLLVRNRWVRDELLRVNDIVYEMNMAELNRGENCGNWRRKIYLSGPSYERMLFEFWRPVSSYYRNSPISWPTDERIGTP